MSRIARDGHVYMLRPDISPQEREDVLPRPFREGVKEASTFTGFCGFHDNQTFEPIERNAFESSSEHTFLLGYRAICRELFLKRAELELAEYLLTLDKGKSVAEQIQHQDKYQAFKAGVELGVRELTYHKSCYDDALLSADFSSVYFYVVRFSDVPDIMCSGARQVEYDFDGNVLQRLPVLEGVPDQLTFSLMATDTGGVAVFNWLGESAHCKQFIRSLDSIPNDKLPHALVRLTFDFFENVAISPVWWDSLDQVSQEVLRRRAAYLVDPADIDPHSLKDDGLRLVFWQVVARETNIDLCSTENR